MRVVMDYAAGASGWHREFSMKAVPRVGERVHIGENEYAVKHVIWHLEDDGLLSFVYVVLGAQVYTGRD